MSGLGWFRQDSACASATEVIRLARALAISPITALGIITAIEAQLSFHAPDGDLNDVTDMLGTWAQWEGDHDAFAAAFVDAVTGGSGIMGAWLDRNSGPMGDAERARERMRRYRQRKRTGQSGPDYSEWEQSQHGSAFGNAFPPPDADR